MKVIFLDIDGVLNGHTNSRMDNGWYRIEENKTKLLNKFLRARPDVKIVISSAWRYMICEEAMTLKGFMYVLTIAGLDCWNRILDHTVRDHVIPDREDQILNWVEKHNPEEWMVIDDLDLVLDPKHFLQTDGSVGLTEADVDRLIKEFSK